MRQCDLSRLPDLPPIAGYSCYTIFTILSAITQVDIDDSSAVIGYVICKQCVSVEDEGGYEIAHILHEENTLPMRDTSCIPLSLTDIELQIM